MSITELAIIGFLFGVLLSLSPVVIGVFTLVLTSLSGRYGKTNTAALIANVYILIFASLVALLSLGLAYVLSKADSTYLNAWVVLSVVASNVVGLYLLRAYFVHKGLHITSTGLKHSIKKSATLRQPMQSVGLSAWYGFIAAMPTIGIGALLLSTLSSAASLDTLVWLLPFLLALIFVLYYVQLHATSKNGLQNIIRWQKKYRASMYAYTGIALIALSWLMLYAILTGITA